MIEKSILLILPALDFNEREFLITKGVLEKLGFRLFIASDSNSLCVGSGGLKVRPDVSFFNMHERNFAAVVFIGGSGVKKYWDNRGLHSTAISFHKSKKPVAAICSAPAILAKAGLLNKLDATCHPSDKKELERYGAKFIDNSIVQNENIITAQGPESAALFAQAVANRIRKKLV